MVILEARTACSGATGRNGGHLVSDTCERFADLVDALGPEEATKMLRFSEANIAELKDLVAQFSESEQDAVELRELNATTVLADRESVEEMGHCFDLFKKTVGQTTLGYELSENEETIRVRELRTST